MTHFDDRSETTIEIVRFVSEHIPAAVELEQTCFEAPWSARAFELFLGNDAVAFTALFQGVPVGYGGMYLAPGDGQITNIAVNPAYRRRGIGRRLLTKLIDAAKELELELVSLEVRVSNQPAVTLYQQSGFAIEGLRKHFYKHPAEDAYVMIRSLRAGS